MSTLTALPLLAAPLLFAPIQESAASRHDFVQKPPTGCLAYAEWRRPQDTLAIVEEHEVLAPLLGEFARQALGEEAELAALVDALSVEGEATSTTLARVCGDGVSAWLAFEQFEPVVCFALPADDEAEGETRRGALLRAIEQVAGVPTGALDGAAETVGDALVWDFDGELCVVGKGRMTYLSNSRRALDAVVEPRRLVRGRRALERLETAHAARSDGSNLYAWVDMGAISALAGLAGGALGDEGPGALLAQLQELPRDPQAQSLLGPGIANLARGRSWSLTLEVAPATLSVELASDGVEGLGGLEPHGPAPRPRANAADLGHALVHRDLATMLREREALFDAPKLADIAMTVSQLELFLGGLTLADDVLPAVSPWIEVIAREVPFESAPRPDLRLPAAAFVLDVSNDPEIGAYLDAAFQSLVAVTSVGLAEQGQPPLRLALGRDDDHTWTAAHYPPPAEGAPVDALYNFAPAAAQVGEHWIVATHEELLVQLLDELPARTTAAPTGTERDARTERLVVDGPALAAMVAPQLDALALMQALEDGVPREEAYEDLLGLVWLLERTSATAEVRYADEAVVLGIDLDFVRAAAPTTGDE